MADVLDVDRIYPGDHIRLAQIVRVVNGLMFDPDPEELWAKTAEKQRQRLFDLGYTVELLGQSGWQELKPDANGEPRYVHIFEWVVLDVRPGSESPEVLQAGLPALFAILAAIGVLLLGTYVVVKEAAKIVPRFERPLRAATSFAATLGVLFVLFLIARES